MGRVSFLILSSLLLNASIACLTAPALGASSGTVSGTVINGTSGGVPPAGLEVSVVQLDSNRKEVGRKSVRTDPQGRFATDAFQHDAQARYLIATTYLDVIYSKLVEANLADEQPVEMKVFETTTDDTVIEVASDTITVVQGKDDEMEVLQVVRVDNRSDRTFIGRPPASGEKGRLTVSLPLPAGAFDVSLSDTLSAKGAEASSEGMTTSEPVLPGESSYSYAYKVRVPRSGWQLRRPILYATSRIDLLIDDRLTTTAPGFELQERPNLGGKTYSRYRGGPFKPGDILGADVGFPQEGSLSGLLVGAGVSVALLLSFGAATIAGRRRSKPATPMDRDELIRKIAELDAAFAEGELEETTYRSAREHMKKDLIAMTESVGAGL